MSCKISVSSERCVENEDYIIVKAGVSNSISLFDRIALNGDNIENNEIIY